MSGERPCGMCGGKKRIAVTTAADAPDAGWADCPHCRTETPTPAASDLVERNKAAVRGIENDIYVSGDIVGLLSENADALASSEAELAALKQALGEAVPYRTIDASGSPESAGQVGWDWLNDIASSEQGMDPDELLIETPPLDNDGHSAVLYRGTKPVAAYFVVRDQMNFAVLYRWRARAFITTVGDGAH